MLWAACGNRCFEFLFFLHINVRIESWLTHQVGGHGVVVVLPQVQVVGVGAAGGALPEAGPRGHERADHLGVLLFPRLPTENNQKRVCLTLRRREH